MGRAALVNLGDGFGARVVHGKRGGVFWIHGYILDSSCWLPLWERLQGYRHIGIDLPGHGISLPLARDEALSALARRIGARAIAEGADQVVALSFGAMIALQMVLEYPGQFRTLTLGSPLLGGGPFDPQVWRRYEDVKGAFRQAGHGPDLRERWMGAGANLFRGTERVPQLRKQIERQVEGHPWWELSDDSYFRLWHHPQSLRDLRGVDAPTLVLVGEEDGDAVKRSSDLLARVVPSCQRRDLPGLGHLCVLEGVEIVQPLIEAHWRMAAGLESGGADVQCH